MRVTEEILGNVQFAGGELDNADVELSYLADQFPVGSDRYERVEDMRASLKGVIDAVSALEEELRKEWEENSER